MANNENNLDGYNAVEVVLGGVGLFLNDMAAVRAIAVLEGVSGGPASVSDDNMTLRLNAIDVGAGGAGDHLNTLDALNSIVVLKGGAGGHFNDLDAINEWVDFALFVPANALFWGRMFQETGQTVVNHGTGGDYFLGADASASSDDPLRLIPIGLRFDGGDHCAKQSGADTFVGDFLFIVPQKLNVTPTNRAVMGQAVKTFEHRSAGTIFRLDGGAALWTHGNSYVAGDVVMMAVRRIGTDVFFFADGVWSPATALDALDWPLTTLGSDGGLTREYDGDIYDIVGIPSTFTEAEANDVIAGIRRNCENIGSVVFTYIDP